MSLRFAVPRSLNPLAMAMAMMVVAGCGGSEAVGPNEEIAFLVGDWRATRLDVINEADPSMPVDLIALGATFTIKVEPSGLYTAILSVAGAPTPLVEIGTIRLDGGQLVQDVETPSPKTVRIDYSLEGGVLNLYGPTEFDFNQDGQDEPAIADIDLVRD